MKIGDTTPWGIAQWVTKIAPGIVSVSTSSHGGIVLDQKHADLIPDDIEPFTGDKKFWEEDFDCYIPLLLFETEIEQETPVMAQFDFIRAEEIIKNEKPHWWSALVVAVINQTLADAKRKLKEKSTCVE